MEFLPVVNVVQVDRAGEDAAVVGQAARGEDAFARRVIVAVAEDGEIMALDVGLRELLSILAHPGFELREVGLLLAMKLFTASGSSPSAEQVIES